MPNLLAILARAQEADGGLAVGDQANASWKELWVASGRVAAWLTQHAVDVRRVGIELDPSIESIAALVGIWRSGRDAVSIPGSPRGLDSSSDWRASLVAVSEVDLFFSIDPSDTALGETRVIPIRKASSGRRFEEAAGRLVQFTSGSTGTPSEVVLDLDAIGNNTASICERLDWRSTDAYCSWLPLSHDMGLIGVLLTAWTGAGLQGGGSAVLTSPRQFVRAPLVWLRMLGEQRATITAAPDFAWRLASALSNRLRHCDLSSVRVGISGAEPVSANTLRRFSRAFEPFGWKDSAFCTAYGLAEAAVCVSLSQPDEHWRSRWYSGEQLANGVRRPCLASDKGSVEVVACGRALRGIEVTGGRDEATSNLSISSPSLAQSCSTTSDSQGHRWLTTNDVGWVDDSGEVWVVGRNDDILAIRGKKVWMSPIELAISQEPSVRSSSVCATRSAPAGWQLVCEPRIQSGLAQLAADLRRRCTELGAAPDRVVFVASGRTPRTASGKIMREATRQAIADSRLEVIETVSFVA